jgi:putative MATE family efflux protein
MSVHRSGTLLTKGPLLTATLVFGWPLVAGMAFHSLFNLVDLFIVGQLPDSDVAIAAATIPSLVNSILMILYKGVVNAGIALVARRAGVGNRRRGNFEAGQGILLSLLLGVVLGLPPFLFARSICVGFDATGEVLSKATTYLEVVSLGTVTMFLLLQLTGALRAAGNSVLPMILLVGANILNVVLGVWWVFGGLGWPRMGVVGAAWATVVSRGVACIPAMFALYRGFAGLRIRRFAFRWATMSQILRIGIPGCGQLLIRIGQYLYLLKLAAVASPQRLVTAAQAAFGIGVRLDTFAVFSGLGWAAAASTVVGQNLGAGKRERAIRASWLAVGLDAATMLVFAAAYVLFAEPLIRFFGRDVGTVDMDAVVSIGRTYLGLSSAAYVYMAVGLVLSQAMAGAGSTRPSLVIEVVGYGLIGVPLTWFVATHADALGGLRALWLAALATHFAVAVAYVVWFRRGTWAVAGGLR